MVIFYIFSTHLSLSRVVVKSFGFEVPKVCWATVYDMPWFVAHSYGEIEQEARHRLIDAGKAMMFTSKSDQTGLRNKYGITVTESPSIGKIRFVMNETKVKPRGGNIRIAFRPFCGPFILSWFQRPPSSVVEDFGRGLHS